MILNYRAPVSPTTSRPPLIRTIASPSKQPSPIWTKKSPISAKGKTLYSSASRRSHRKSRRSLDKVSRQPPKVIHVVMRQHISEEVADPLARRDVSINLLPARENLLQRPIPHQIAS